MDLYAPITSALANTQSTIVDLMKTFMSNEIAKQAMELEREKMAQENRRIDLQQDRDQRESLRDISADARAQQAREDALRARSEDVSFRTEQANAANISRLNEEERDKALLSNTFDQQAKTWGFKEREMTLAEQQAQREAEKSKRDSELFGLQKQKLTDETTRRPAREFAARYRYSDDVLNTAGINPDASLTQAEFSALMEDKKATIAYTQAAVLQNQLNALKAKGKAETDPTNREAIKKQYDALHAQWSVLNKSLSGNRLSDKLVLEIMKSDELDKEAATKDAMTIIDTFEKHRAEQSPTGRPSDAWDPAAAPGGGQPNGVVTPEIAELKQYFQAKNPAVLREAAAIIQREGQAAGIDFLRKKRQELQSNAPGSAEDDTFGIRPGSALSKIAAVVRRAPNLPDYENMPGLTY